ncbi:MAG: ApaG domain [Verrucomicrobia bacterium]|nr:ApaG domain [Verrucomicrobiota bacterium]
MNTTPRLLDGFTVEINRVIYDPLLERPLGKPHAFVYFITIHNNSDQALTVKGRKWVVREEGGHVTVLEGEGVVGEFPYLLPGEHFSYNSYHVTAGPAVAQGAYLAVTDEREAVMALIPEFELVPRGYFD